MTRSDLQRLDNAIWIVARLIDLSGEDYWPILDRLEKEREAFLSRQDRLARHLARTPLSNGARQH